MRAAEIFPGVRLHFLALPDDASPRYAAGEPRCPHRRFEL